MSALAEALRLIAKDLTPGDAHVPTPNWPRKQRRKLARVLLKLAGDGGLYVARALTPECDARLRAWAASQGLPPLDPHLHVTVAYSRVTVEWANLQGTVSVPRSAFLRWEPLGAEGAVVLRFRSPALHARWAQARKAGATWDHGSAYKPHLTLYYNGPVPRELPDFPLEFGPECTSELGGDCFALHKDFDPSEHPRGEDGKFGGKALSSLQPHHRAALAQYKGAHQEMNAIGLNGKLRDGVPLDDRSTLQVKHLDEAFNHHSKLNAPVTLYRGLSEAPQWRGASQVLDNKGYVSTTSDPDVADMYASLTSEQGHVLEIRMPKGARVVGLDQHAAGQDAISTISEEHEYLLPRGASFRHISSHGNHHVVEYVGAGNRWSLGAKGEAPEYEPHVKKFDTTEHPRDAHGQFVHGAAVAGPLPKGDKRPTVWLGPDGHPLPPEAQAHLQEIAGKGFAAPNYTQQTYYAPDPSRKGTYVGTVVDGKGRSKRFYLDANEQAKYGVKTARVRAFADGYEDYTRKLDVASATGNHDALALRLLTKTGMRPGSDRDTGAEAKAYGATNMPTSAATVTDHTVHFAFPAKNGKTYVTSVEDPVLARHVLARQAAGEPRLFDTNETKVRGLFKQLTGNGMLQLKDIRTAHGTAIAQRELMTHAFKPATAREFAQLQKTISAKVAAALQNTPKVALEKYILDGVWHGYRPHGLKLKAG